MTAAEEDLWQKIKEFEISQAEDQFSFADRLCRENGWNYEYAIRVIYEYKKFIFLICIYNKSLTPSDQVDQVWHLHLIYTYSYWIRFCKETLKRNIHHGPTKGGKSEKDKFIDWYAMTKELYIKQFKTYPPIDIWPDSKTRFGELHFQRINLHRNWVIPKFFKFW